MEEAKFILTLNFLTNDWE